MRIFVENHAQSLELLGAQEAFAPLLPEALDVQAWVRTVRAQAPDLGHVEHLRERAERPVSLVGRLAHRVMQFGDVLPLDLGHLAPADPGIDEEFDETLALARRALFAVVGDVLLEKPLPQNSDGRRPPWPRQAGPSPACAEIRHLSS